MQPEVCYLTAETAAGRDAIAEVMRHSDAADVDVAAPTIHLVEGTPRVTDMAAPGIPVARWPSTALVQLVTGYRSAVLLDVLHRSALPHAALRLLEALFPPCWRLSRNESWTYAR